MKRILLIIFLLLMITNSMDAQYNYPLPAEYPALLDLFKDWRDFENPTLLNGAPDYTADRFNKEHQAFKDLEKRLTQIEIDDWPIPYQVDWHIVRAEMNGYDFNYRVLQPWVRDPAYYQTVWMLQSDVPAHEGPTNHATLELWTYQFPLTHDEEKRLTDDLEVIPTFLEQARGNLTGNARDLWVAGIENFKQQARDLDQITEGLEGSKVKSGLLGALDNAQDATKYFIAWLEEQATGKTGSSGIGKEQYTWYQKNVHLLPFTWEEEVQLLQRELDRAWSSLKLEEQRNKDLPPMSAANTPEDFAQLKEQGVQRFMNFLKEKEIMIIKSNMEPALREHMGQFVPEDERNFFSIGMHYDPVPLYSHFIHWFDLAQVRDEPHESPIRRGPLLYNIFDSKNEGIATSVEEMFMHAGLYEDSPRSREIVWIMIAQRAARGLGSLYAHANEMTMAEASQVHVKWTPRGWMKREPHLLQFEQHFYLRQPGYGTSYITGKYLIERLLAEWSEQLEEQEKPFVMKDFFKAFNDAGNIPVELVRWQMTGIKSNHKDIK
ncbi:MAG: hypothetical protein QF814_02350 [Candidatus Marinimicrobia bacterium]|jgi:hypothetical protein|nr:hypothetical protein [Candidatus Neomarinimicrobiota bacterium]